MIWGFGWNGPRGALGTDRAADISVLQDIDRPILQGMSRGLAWCRAPLPRWQIGLAWLRRHCLARVAVLAERVYLTRIGVIVRHRAIGWRANAMVVWDVPEDRIPAAGRALAALPGVTLCYQRRVVPGVWPYALFSMIHAQTRPQALAVLDQAAALPELARRAARGAVFSALLQTDGRAFAS